jgi:hypothetical protein
MLFLLQQGHGMLDLDKDFITDHPQSGVILSPRICSQEQVERHAGEVLDLGGELLFDPQFYEPRTNLDRLLTFPYWDGLDFDSADFIINSAGRFCERVINYQVENLNVTKVIIPGRFTNSADTAWRELQGTFAESAAALAVDRHLYSTVAIGSDVIMSGELFDNILDEIVSYPVNGIYIVVRPSKDSFLVDNDLFLYALLDGLLSISLSGKDVILGYANQQSLICAGAGISTLASGNYRNVRHFNPEMFYVDESEKRKKTWFYDPQTLSEYRLENLALAFRRGLGGYFQQTCEHCEPLIRSSAASPWREPQAFRHYLHEMHRQWLSFDTVPRNERVLTVSALLTSVQSRITELNERRFSFGDRAFNNVIEASMNAVNSFEGDRERDILNL